MSDEERWGRHLANKAAMHGLSDAGPMSAEAKLDRFRDHHREQVDALEAEVAALTAERDRLREERDKALRAHVAALIESRIWERRNERAEAERDTLAAQLARAETANVKIYLRRCAEWAARIAAGETP